MEPSMKTLSIIALLSVIGSPIGATSELAVPHSDLDDRAPLPTFGPRATVTITGEVRTVDDEERPRLWGKGRYGVVRYGTTGLESGLCTSSDGTVEFGLSNVVATWDSVDHACPAGTWVCTSNDVGSDSFTCDTDRPDTTSDGFNCDGTDINYQPESHAGWTSDLSSPGGLYKLWNEGTTWAETTLACRMHPVWCCSEATSP